ncbi:hypothetical protein ASPZODRAFT_19277 [Penicilliopsis zonata CBS 506.65]|uniref:Zn(2)-C6 fungal-type domain-containing protein n=1 Tax=Penicilliopsis zonata CBS 506.65 TaxID=1073090 RepID=A0A1L9S8S8_9EURO|nr:hypothetical protein ASPZODRAFT_19277 [Penicilliopsis zonata CBS 506.65]OJJ43554.1 hypothetical protein ASPZODRAFT_19277 [Penicilliopsis zonata CBS 506.65]
MVFRGRVSRSCENCRAVKRRCDQQVPHCGQCRRMGEDCPGYRDEWELMFRNQTDMTIKRSKGKSTRRRAVVKTQQNNTNRPGHGLAPGVDELGVNYFLHNFVIGGKSPSHGYLNYIPAVYMADGEHPTLVSSMAAVGLVALARSTQQPELVQYARAKYSEAIGHVNHALASPTESVKDSTLMAVISLGVFELGFDVDLWVRHVQGAAALVVLRGKKQFTSKASILMFNQVRADMVIACLHTVQPFPPEIVELQQAATDHSDTSSAFWLLGVLAPRCANVFHRFTRNTGEIPWLELLEEATGVQDDIEHIASLLEVQAPYTTTYESTADPDRVYNGRVDVYASFWAIRVWNNMRNCQIIVSQIVCSLLTTALDTDLAPDLAPDLKAYCRAKLKETLQLLVKIGDDMLASIPQALGLTSGSNTISTQSKPQSSMNPSPLPSHTSLSAGLMLLWCLYTVGMSPVITSKARRWVIQRMTDIGKNAGISFALHLVKDLVRSDELLIDSP